MSFSTTVKNEVARFILSNKLEIETELAAFVRMNATFIMIPQKGVNLKFSTENAAIARRIFSFIRDCYNGDVNVSTSRNIQLKKNNSYLIEIVDINISKKILEDTGFYNLDSNGFAFLSEPEVPKRLLNSPEKSRAYIRAAFLAAGSITNPEKNYHMEFIVGNNTNAKILIKQLRKFNLKPKKIVRKGTMIVYLKEAEQISDVLNIINAHSALLEFENIRVIKDMRNNVNRIVNCETANMSKTINASIQQLANIEIIEETIGLSALPEALREVAELRKEHSDLGLKEIGELLNPRLSKSGVNHRLKRIQEIAEECEEKLKKN